MFCVTPVSQILKFQLRDVDCFTDGKGYAVSSVEGRVAWEYFDPALGPMGAKENYAFKCHRDKGEGGSYRSNFLLHIGT